MTTAEITEKRRAAVLAHNKRQAAEGIKRRKSRKVATEQKAIHKGLGTEKKPTSSQTDATVQAATSLASSAQDVSSSGGGETDTGAAVATGAMSGAASGAAIGSIVPGIGTAIGAGVGAVAGAVMGAAKANASRIKNNREVQVELKKEKGRIAGTKGQSIQLALANMGARMGQSLG